MISLAAIRKGLLPLALSAALLIPGPGPASAAAEANLTVERISGAVPFPRGLVLRDGSLFVLARGRVRGAGGASTALDDRAGTIYRIDPAQSQPIGQPVSDTILNNGEVFAEPTDPPFRLFDRTVATPTDDRRTDRPYCTLRFHEPTRSFYLCAFSGIDKPKAPGTRDFSKNLTDGLLRYDLRTSRWHEVERHAIEAGGNYPHHDPATEPPPHGWLNGPDNCLAVGNTLYAVAKDNSLLVRYDLSALIDDPEAGPPPSHFVLDHHIHINGQGLQRVYGHSMLAHHGDHLYIGARTSSTIFRIPLHADGLPIEPILAEIVAQFDPYNPATGKSANLTDMDFDAQGRLYVVSAKPSRIYRFVPDPDHIFDARGGAEAPWADLASITGNPGMKSENVLIDAQGRAYVTAGDAYGVSGLAGMVYRITPGP